MSRLLKFSVAALVFPSALLVGFETLRAVFALVSNIRATLFFCAGAVLYLPVHYMFGGAGAVYVFAHELAHALAGLLCGFRIRSFSVNSRNGQVELSGSNFFVALAPYCLPVYAVALLAAYFAASLRWDLSGWAGWFTGGFGFFLSFHAVNTFELLWTTRQSDLKQAGGVFFSWAVIIAANSVVLLAAFRLLYPELISVHLAALLVWRNTVVFWRWAWHLSALAARKAFAWAAVQFS